jgi:hypothetical protein
MEECQLAAVKPLLATSEVFVLSRTLANTANTTTPDNNEGCALIRDGGQSPPDQPPPDQPPPDQPGGGEQGDVQPEVHVTVNVTNAPPTQQVLPQTGGSN